MSYPFVISASLGKGKTGLAATLRAQLTDGACVNVGAAQSGFIERGASGGYRILMTIPDGHRGGVDVYDTSAPTDILANAEINPEETENPDVKTSTRLATAGYTVPAVPGDAMSLTSTAFDTINIDGISARQALAVILAADVGKLSGVVADSNPQIVTVFAAGSPTTPRIVYHADGIGNRVSVDITPPSLLPTPTLDLSAATLSSLFQDSSFTTPVTANNDPVGGEQDLSGNANHFAQTDNTKRPLYDATNKALVFDGTDDVLSRPTQDTFLSGQSGSFYFIFKYQSTTTGYIFNTQANNAPYDYVGIYVYQAAGLYLDVRYGGVEDQGYIDIAEFVDDTWYLVEFHSDGTAYTAILNGVSKSLTMDVGSNNGVWFGDLQGGSYNTAYGPFGFNSSQKALRIYDGITITDAQKAAIRAELNAKHNVY